MANSQNIPTFEKLLDTETMKKRYILPLLALCGVGGISAQTLSQAQKWFNDKQFDKAKPVFQRLVKQSPSNANYNFWYGACCYETGALQESVPYLEKSAERKVINGFLYLSKAYFDLYRFDEAIENLEDHIYWMERKNRDTSDLDTLMNRYRMGARMMRGVENVAVIDSFVVDKNNFLQAYKINEESGKVGLTGESDCTEFTNGMKDKKILSHRVPGTNQKALYVSSTLGGDWTVPEKVKGLDEAGTDLNYPFINSDGVTLYFAAKGDESLGGYDIFITRYDSEEGSYLKPDNMGFPFNSPFNDYLYVIDDFNNLGWFASDRYQPEGKVCVYVFSPNSSKQVYDYDTTDPGLLSNVAMLNGIRNTWSDADKVRIAKQQLAQVMYGENEQEKKGDFRFVVDDNAIYHTLSDFRSDDARKKYQQFQQKEKDLDTLNESLAQIRANYASSNTQLKDKLTPGILDREKRVKELYEEIEKLTLDIRNTEIKKLKNL